MAQMPKKIEMATKEPSRERIPSIRKPQIRRSVSFDCVGQEGESIKSAEESLSSFLSTGKTADYTLGPKGM